MKIIKKKQNIRTSNGMLFIRETYSDDSTAWVIGGLPMSEKESAVLEKEYQALPPYARQNSSN